MDIKQKIIRDQDILSIYFINADNNKALGIFENYSEEHSIRYKNIQKYILSNEEILKDFSIQNFFNFLYTLPRDNKEQNDRIISSFMDRLKKEDFFCMDIDTECFLKPIHSTNVVCNILGQENINKIIEGLRERFLKVPDEKLRALIKKETTIIDIANFLKYYEEGAFSKEKINFLEKMIENDEKGLRYVNFGLFQDEIFKLGDEFIGYISKFPSLSAQLVILHKNNPKLFEIFSNHLNSYDSLTDNFEEIEILISSFAKISNEIEIKELDINVTNNIIEWSLLDSKVKRGMDYIGIEYCENSFEKLDKKYDEEYNLITKKEISSLEKLKVCEEKLSLYNEEKASIEERLEHVFLPMSFKFQKEEYEKLINEKKNIYINKIFSMSINDAEKFLQQYAADIENINIDEEIKEKVKTIKETLETLKTTDNIDQLYKDAKKEIFPSGLLKIKKELSKAFVLDYMKTFKSVDEKIKNIISSKENVDEIDVDGNKVQVVKLTGEYNLLLHSSDAGFVNTREINEDTNFKKHWQTGTDKSNHVISTTYFTNNFMGCAPVGNNGVMYAFTSKNTEKIKLMGVTDINTYMREFSYSSSEKQYMSAKTMDKNARRVYSEFALERENTNPDYVVLFDDMSEEVKKNTYKAAADFGIPVLFIDKKEIEKEQLNHLDELMDEFEKGKDIEVLKSLINTYETNVAGWLLNRSEKDDVSYTAGIDNSRFKQDFDKKWEDIHGVIKNYIKEIKDNNQVEELTRLTEIILEERDLYEKCEEMKPISKTRLSFNANEILETINNTFEEIGQKERKVDLEKIPNVKEYKLKMSKIAENAFRSGITDNDVKIAENFRNKNPKLDKDEKGNGEIDE